MDSIVDAMQTANSNPNVIVLTIPCWTQHSNGNSDATHRAVEDYNASPNSRRQSRQGVRVIDVNRSIMDVASSKPFHGVYRPCSTIPDRPPSQVQGDLIMAGNIARATGYAGRAAGPMCRDAGEMAVHFHQDGGMPA